MRTLRTKNDINEFTSTLKLPVTVLIREEKDDQDPQKWNDLNAHFHAGVVPTFCAHTGYNRKEGKEELQKMFALISETEEYWEVESIGGMNLKRLMDFVLQCSSHISLSYGDWPTETIKPETKRILKAK